ncbi:uncharacterized protein LOC124126503 [Haliotis rufescens]|uniref:uncharacterized protein LOC124126503 n=1 Tax=Haliotis rufescens TaxID=6454 RepID=UPI00201E89B6|nr:uncharacterized protein LOC124126503 [Haliotis rufescens]
MMTTMSGARSAVLPRVLVLLGLVGVVASHGYLLEPPQRSSMWRVGFGTPVNYNDMELNCGGKQRQHQMNGGRCGICGDAYDSIIRDNEVGGKYANGIIVRSYRVGSDITATVRLTTYHKGYFEFRLCPDPSTSGYGVQDCLNRFLMPVRMLGSGEGGKERFFPGAGNSDYVLQVSLPPGVTCNTCLFQWRYVTGKDWGRDPEAEDGCVGCGPQEWFVNCADVNIYATDAPTPTTPQPSTYSTTSTTTTTTTTTTTLRPTTRTVPTSGDSSKCVAADSFARVPGMNTWCQQLCPRFCPSTHCVCA